MVKVGIMTMHRIKNYGSLLQAYCLKRIVENLGFAVEFVDYHIEKPLNEDGIKCRHCNKIVEVIKQKATFKHKIQFMNYKCNFNKNIYQLLNVDDHYHYNTKVDILLIGSDEVFNCLQHNVNVGYSLELFGKNSNARKIITYAASFGNTTLEKLSYFRKEKEIGYYLNKISAISVRDKNSEQIVTKILPQKKIYKHLDPTLIYDFSNDVNITFEHTVLDKYIILYAYNNRITTEENQKIKKYATEHGYKIYCIGGVHSCADKFIDCSPFEIFAYFKNAQCIITDTFHGTIFSIINKKPFVTLIRESDKQSYGNKEKITDLLDTLELNDRIISDCSFIERVISRKIDYSKVNKKIIRERKKTYKYLLDNLASK